MDLEERANLLNKFYELVRMKMRTKRQAYHKSDPTTFIQFIDKEIAAMIARWLQAEPPTYWSSNVGFLSKV